MRARGTPPAPQPDGAASKTGVDSFMRQAGLPDEALSPVARAAIADLLAEDQRLQEELERARDRAATLAVDVDLRMYAPGKFWRELSEPQGAVGDPRLPAVGTRRWFSTYGKIYESLSSIASSVTGTHWNGFAFFA